MRRMIFALGLCCAADLWAGFDVTWYRYIAKNGKQTKETLFTRYDAGCDAG